MASAQELGQDLRQLGISEAEMLLVHTSFRSLGPIEGGPETLISVLLELVGDEGTLIMPCNSAMAPGKQEAIFDLKNSPSTSGLVSETFRTRQDSRRSLHPSHSACASGAKAHALVLAHQLDAVAYGPHSPIALLPSYGAKVLMIGCGLEPNCSIHAIEELVEVPYLQEAWRTWTLIDEEGASIQKDYRFHRYENGYQTCFERIKPLMSPSGLRWGRVGAADCWLIDSAELWDKLVKVLRKDPFFLVEKPGDGTLLQ